MSSWEISRTSTTGEQSQAPGEAEEVPPRRQCGRCRKMFGGDPTLHHVALHGWWLCPPCREALLGASETDRSVRQ